MRTIIIISSTHPTLSTLLAAALLATSAVTAAASHQYTVTVDNALRRLEIIARFAKPVGEISARSRSAGQFLIDASDCDSNAQLPIRPRRLLLPAQGTRCLRYSVDLEKAAQADERNNALSASNVIVSPTVWMWQPRLAQSDELIVRFELGQNIKVSVPWIPIDASDNSYRLVASPQSGTAISLFGRFEALVANVGRDALRVDVLRSAEQVDHSQIVAWIEDTARNIARAYGRFPNPAARIVVFPIGDGFRDSAVQFGRVVRDGGETIELFIDPKQPIESFYESWTATHEFTHLMLPYLRREQRWISEGFAQYYQNVLLARAGRYTQRYAWQKLFDGLQRGRESVPGLSPNEAARRDERNHRMKIYWSGAALALLADTELRHRSNGEETLDAVLEQFQRCCLPSQRTWSGAELFTKFDSFLDAPLFMTLYRRHADTAGFPAVSARLEQLGVTRKSDEIVLQDDAELAHIRMALTRRDASVGPHPQPPRDR